MYEKYERRMMRLRHILTKYGRVIVSVVGVILLLLVLWFGVGFPLRRVTCDDIIYGEKPAPSAEYTAGRVEYEYRSENGEWSKEIPHTVGQYEVRGKLTTPFGIRYGLGDDSFTIDKAELTVRAPDVEIYGTLDWGALDGVLPEVKGLQQGDSVVDCSYVLVEEDVYIVDTLTIVHADGTSAENCYRFQTEPGRFIDIRLPLSILPESKQEVYSGDPDKTLRCEGYTIIEGKLLEGHTGHFSSSTVVQGVGSEIIEGIFTVTDTENKDVSFMYRIEILRATLALSPRTIVIQSDSATKFYDGTALVAHSGKIVSGELASGKDVLEIRYSGSQTAPGVSENTCVGTISQDGRDVTWAYDIVYRFGTLRVIAGQEGKNSNGSMAISRKPFSDSHRGEGSDKTILFEFRGEGSSTYYLRQKTYMNYDGTSWSNPEIRYEPEGSQLFGKALRDRGEPQSRVEVRNLILAERVIPYFMAGNSESGDGIDYDYACTVYSPESYDNLPISQETWEKDYSAYVHQNYLQISPELKNVMLTYLESMGCTRENMNVENDPLAALSKIAYAICCAGTYDMDFPEVPEGNDIVSFFIQTSGRGICQHFASAGVMACRAIGIPARYVIGFAEQANGREWVRVGTIGHAWVEAYVDGSGWIPLEVTGSTDSGFGLNVGIVEGEKNGGSKGEEKQGILVGVENYSKEYDGQGVGSFEPAAYISKGSLKPGHRLEYKLDPVDKTDPEVGVMNVYFSELRVVDATGKDVSDEYLIFNQPGTVEIHPRVIVLGTGTKEADPDAGSISEQQWCILEGSLVNGHSISVQMSSVQDGEGMTYNRIDSVKIVNEHGVSMMSYYVVKIIEGTLEIR